MGVVSFCDFQELGLPSHKQNLRLGQKASEGQVFELEL